MDFDNLSDKDKERAQKLMSEVHESLLDKFNNVFKIGNTIENKLKDFQTKLINHLKTKCSDEYKAIETLANITKDDQGKFDLKVAEDKKSEFEEKSKKWESCAHKNDFGAQDFFVKMGDLNYKIENESSDCIYKCISTLKNQSDNEAKTCLTGCLTNFYDKSYKNMVDINGSLDDFNKKL